jgi:maltose O-acetyltransferase
MKRPYRRDTLVWLAGLDLMPHRARPALLRAAGLRVEEGVSIRGGLKIVGNQDVTLRSGAFLSYRVLIEADAPISIGTNVHLGASTQVLAGSHEVGGPTQRAGNSVASAVKIDDGAWLGAGVIVLPGVTVGAGCIVGAGAVVTTDLDPHRLYAGVPAKPVRALETA